LALRLKVVNRQITEAEHVFARIDAPAQAAALQTPRPALLATVPPAERMPRSMMFLVANAYYDASFLATASGRRLPTTAAAARTHAHGGRRSSGASRPAARAPAVLRVERPRDTRSSSNTASHSSARNYQRWLTRLTIATIGTIA
jgi:hypothetical protein